MGYFFIDDSVHANGGFITLAFVYLKRNPSKTIERALLSCGLTPGKDEFKSGIRMDKHPEQIKLRSLLKRVIVRRVSIGLAFHPVRERERQFETAIEALMHFIEHNGLTGRHKIFFDKGICPKSKDRAVLVQKFNLKKYKVNFEQDSKIVMGIQLADLVAHSCSIMLVESIGLLRKVIKDRNGLECELGFQLFRENRYNFFAGDPDKMTGDFIKDATMPVEPNGLFVSSLCDSGLASDIRLRFHEIYLGCTV